MHEELLNIPLLIPLILEITVNVFFPVFAFTIQWNLYRVDTNGAKKVLTL